MAPKLSHVLFSPALHAMATVSLLAAAALAAPAAAGSRKAPTTVEGGAHPASGYYRRGPQVRGYVKRRGGYYSYRPADTINTYGDARTLFGGTNTYRDSFLDRQTDAGPFDHGFFFDSGIGPRGGNSPYLN